MKKFLIFLVALVVVVSIGVTTFYFLRNDEIINVGTKEIYCNVGDTISLDELNITIKKASRRTTFDYNAGGEEVTNLISYNKDKGYYIVSTEHGGDVSLVIGTSNKKYARFTVNVHIGDGTAENPYYIFNETDLSLMGVNYRLDSATNYKLMSDIVLTKAFKPIGFSSVSQTWEGFSGTFNGNGHKISGLNVSDDMVSAGLFSTINLNANVYNLTVENATLSGSFDNVGALAGVIAGNVSKVQAKNVAINNTKSAGNSGAFAGEVSGKVVSSYVDNANVTAGSETQVLTSGNIGGFVGELNKGTIEASYVNVGELTISGTANVGGFVGEFVVAEKAGTIQQSYANTNSAYADFGAFIGKIDSTLVPAGTGKYMLRHLVGNAVVTGKANATDNDLVHSFDNTYFVNSSYAGESVFEHENAALYMIQAYATTTDMINADGYVFYAMSTTEKTLWDTDYIWAVHTNQLPTLRMGSSSILEATAAYYTKDTSTKYVVNNNFVSTFNADKEGEKYSVLEDVDLTDGNWTPVALTNCTIDGIKADGTNAKIRVNLKNAVAGNLGLFTILDGCSISNLDIIVTNVGANAENFGGLASQVKATMGSSSINNVNIIYQTTIAKNITNLGGIAASISNTSIAGCSVQNLKDVEAGIVNYAAGLVVNVESGEIKNTVVSADIYARNAVAGAVVNNNGTLLAITGEVKLALSARDNTIAFLGGVVAQNNGEIMDAEFTVDANINRANATVVAGGVVANNGDETSIDALISNAKVLGTGIAIDSNITQTAYVGGVAGYNYGTLKNVYNLLDTVGTYSLNKNFYVGGVACFNNGTIEQAVASADLNGNYVGGVAVFMNEQTKSPKIDQVLVGKYAYDAENETYSISRNTLMADKYVAGVVFDVRFGIIKNVQTVSLIDGTTNNTKASLNLLIAPNGSKVSNIAINSAFTNTGVHYRDTWSDYYRYVDNAGEYKIELPTGQNWETAFRVYSSLSYVCEMNNVVVNNSNENVASAIVGTSLDDYNEVNYIVPLTNAQFNRATSFNLATYNITVGQESLWYTLWLAKGDKVVERTVTFDVGTTESQAAWVENNGIELNFISSVK